MVLRSRILWVTSSANLATTVTALSEPAGLPNGADGVGGAALDGFRLSGVLVRHRRRC